MFTPNHLPTNLTGTTVIFFFFFFKNKEHWVRAKRVGKHMHRCQPIEAP